ncbi:hypothetical protein BGZ90_009825 [Linnemannia elongata]|nr:hypothetical protein BGZ90_009825 [Linnemannia elongata]
MPNTTTPLSAATAKVLVVSSSIPVSTFTSVSSPTLAAAAAAPLQQQDQHHEALKDVVYKILYFKLHGMAATTRIMLALSGALWESIYPQDWANEKHETPFGLMPILYETHLSSNLTLEVLLAFPDTKSRELAKFVEKEVPAWIVQHEKWLGRSQTPGFYVGNQLSIADIHSVVCLDRFLTIPECKELFSPEKTPNLFKLKHNLESYPRYTAWMTSPEFEAINISTRQRLAVLKG